MASPIHPIPVVTAFEGGPPLVVPVHVLIAGRTRLKIGGLYRSPAMKRLLEERLSDRVGVEIVSIGLLTGNVLLRHDPAASVRDIVRLVEAAVAEGAPERAVSNEKHPPMKIPSRRRSLRKRVLKGETQKSTDWHRRDVPEVFCRLVSGYGGLLPAAAAAKLRQYGPNLLPEPVPRSGFTILLDQVKSLPMLLLFISAGVSVATGGLADAAVILSVVAINAVIGYTTESRAEMIINSLKRLVHPSATLLRGGRTVSVPAEEVVPGDVVVLRPGVLIPADCRIIDAQALTVDESALTGESLPVRKTIAPLELSSIPLAERTNMAYMGTLVTGGQGLAVVVATARYTELGAIQALVGETEQPKTPMERELDRIGNRLIRTSAALCGGLFIVGLLRGFSFLQMVKTSIALGVAAIPEGLPTVATTVLALGIHRMKRRHALIRRLTAVETLGAVGTICLDKTGTLTMNRMSVRAVVAGEVFYDVIDGTLLHEGEKIAAAAVPEILHLLQVAALCNEAVTGNAQVSARSSATESALLSLALASGMDVEKLRRHFPLLRTTHRAEGQNYMITTHKFGADETGSQRLFLALKGNPSEVLSLCSLVITKSGVVPLDEDGRLAAELANERMAGQALRVLGAAYAVTEGLVEEPAFIWTGLIGLADPIRPGMKELIAAFHSAGIDTVMITGDQVATAYAVGRELQLSGNGKLEIFDAAMLEKTDPELLAALARKVHVFARVNPAQKLRIVQALQRGGQIVAMTGDGINDTPALKAADIGIAMGSTGTDAAREVADVVLEDDNLRTLVGAIEQGRTIYGNIRKSVRFLLSTNFSEIFVMTAAVALGLGQPLNPMQLLWINLVSDIFPGLALSLEAPESDVLRRPPRSPDTPILGDADMKEMMRESAVLSAGSLAAYGYGILRYGRGPQAASLAFMSLTTGQILHTLSCRSEKPVVFAGKALPPNRYLTAAVGGTLLLQGGALLVPPLRSFLGLTGMPLLDLLVAGGGAVLPLVVNEGAKEERNSR